jgi:hypothetical protein
MNIEKQLCTISQSRRLKELGVLQESQCCHYQEQTPRNPNLHEYGWPQENMPWHISTTGKRSRISGNSVLYEYSAFSVAELGQLLPDLLSTDRQYELVCVKEDDCWLVMYVAGNDLCDVLHKKAAKNEADAKATMLIYLLENKLVDVSICNESLLG